MWVSAMSGAVRISDILLLESVPAEVGGRFLRAAEGRNEVTSRAIARVGRGHPRRRSNAVLPELGKSGSALACHGRKLQKSPLLSIPTLALAVEAGDR